MLFADVTLARRLEMTDALAGVEFARSWARLNSFTGDDPFIDWNPVWSPDGEYLYFISNRKGVMRLWRVAIDQASGRARGEPESVPTPASDTQHTSFSSDGKRLAYVGASYTQNIKG